MPVLTDTCSSFFPPLLHILRSVLWGFLPGPVQQDLAQALNWFGLVWSLLGNDAQKGCVARPCEPIVLPAF